jgi:DNA-binding phage protein
VTRARKSPLPIDILAPDPFDAGALLLSAVAAHRAATGESDAALAARCKGPNGRPLTRSALCRALRPGSDARPATVRAVCRALGLKVALVPVGEG